MLLVAIDLIDWFVSFLISASDPYARSMRYLNGYDTLPPQNSMEVFPFRPEIRWEFLTDSYRFDSKGHNAWGHGHDNEPSIASSDVDDLHITSSFFIS